MERRNRENQIDPSLIEKKLKDKIESEKHLYDFKYIKRKFKSPAQADQGVYLTKQ